MNVFDTVAGAVLATSSDAIVAADREGTIVLWNPGAERIFGFAATDAVGQSLDLIIPVQLRQRHWDGYHAVIKTGQSRYAHGDLLAVPAIKQDGTRISIEFTITPLRNENGELAGLVAIMRDVTTRFGEMRALKRKLAQVMQQSG